MAIGFYSLKEILKRNAQYNVIFGGRSNGKTYACFEYGLREYVKTGKQMALVRRWRDDFIGKRGTLMFENHVNNNLISKLTKGKWTGVYYYASKWYLMAYDENENRIIDETPFCFAFALTSMEHDKSTAYPNVTTIVFDEFITRTNYVPDEFVLFMNVVSTIVRHRTDVKIFMCGNTVNKYNPYFKEMGLVHAKNMEMGTIDLYRYGDSNLKVAVEYTKPIALSGTTSNEYFAFNNPKLQMITGGVWELDIYPHCPVKIKPKDIQFTYFIIFDGECLQCNIVQQDDNWFTFIHRRTSPIRNMDDELIYTNNYNARYNYVRKITKPTTPIEKKIASFYIKDKIFYSDNEVGEIVRNYLMWCGKAL